MSVYEVLVIIISALSLSTAFLSCLSAFISSKSSKEAAEIAKRINFGMVEMEIRTKINSASNRRDDVMIKLAGYEDSISSLDDDKDDSHEKNALKYAADSAVENWLNAYDDACGLYIDNKLDKERFKKNYYHEIIELIEDKEFENYFVPEYKSRYYKLIMVYKEWTKLEVTENK
jgi:hypothetical protein